MGQLHYMQQGLENTWGLRQIWFEFDGPPRIRAALKLGSGHPHE
jgi:hypothetical protein